MTANTSPLLSSICALAKIDSSIARIKAERVKLSKDLALKEDNLRKSESQLAVKKKQLAEKRHHYDRDDKEIKFEQEKLVQRRKSLASLGNYKTQAAASREIEHAARQLSSREELLLTSLIDIEKLEKDCSEIEKVITGLRSEVETLRKDTSEHVKSLEEREKAQQKDREQSAVSVDKASISTYNRIKDRFPIDPVVAIKNGSCAGCFIQVGPQAVVQISKGDALIKCRGCGRILILDEQPAAT